MARKVTLEPRQCAPSLRTANVRTHTRTVFEELAARFEIYYAWGNGGTGDHKAGKALDLMAYDKLKGSGPSGFAYQADGDVIPGPIRKGWNKTVAEYVWANRVRLGVDYVIYDQVGQSNNPGGSLYGGWKTYTGLSHANHVHISFEERPPAYRPPTGEPAAPPKESDDMPTVAEFWNAKVVPNKNAPSEKAHGMATPATILSNIEATQDVDHGLLVKMSAQLGAINGAMGELAKALAAHTEGVDADALVAAVRGAAEAGALSALESIPVATVVARTSNEEEPS